MYDVEIEYHERVPIFILNSTFKYFSEMKQLLEKEPINNSKEIIIDLSNFLKIDSDTLNNLTEIVKAYGNRINRFGVIIPKEVVIEGLKIKLIHNLIEIYETKYDAIYNFLN